MLQFGRTLPHSARAHRRDRAIIVAALCVLTILAWADLVWLADNMSMGGMDMTGFRMIPAGQSLMMPASEPWKPIEFGYVFAMWAVMMIGMMTPSAAPMILIYARVGPWSWRLRPRTIRSALSFPRKGRATRICSAF
ncbi:MAG: hypothetical protein WBL84_07820 [Xanthobacteraceae bacterium]